MLAFIVWLVLMGVMLRAFALCTRHDDEREVATRDKAPRAIAVDRGARNVLRTRQRARGDYSPRTRVATKGDHNVSVN